MWKEKKKKLQNIIDTENLTPDQLTIIIEDIFVMHYDSVN